MIIVISQRIDFISERNEYRESIDQNLLRLINNLGHIPIQVPNVLFEKNNAKKLIQWLIEVKPGGLVLSGGNDMGDYNDRDATEKFLYRWFEKNDKPILGICRGMQMIGVFNNVELKKVSNHVNVNHFIFQNLRKKIQEIAFTIILLSNVLKDLKFYLPLKMEKLNQLNTRLKKYMVLCGILNVKYHS